MLHLPPNWQIWSPVEEIMQLSLLIEAVEQVITRSVTNPSVLNVSKD